MIRGITCSITSGRRERDVLVGDQFPRDVDRGSEVNPEAEPALAPTWAKQKIQCNALVKTKAISDLGF